MGKGGAAPCAGATPLYDMRRPTLRALFRQCVRRLAVRSVLEAFSSTSRSRPAGSCSHSRQRNRRSLAIDLGPHLGAVEDRTSILRQVAVVSLQQSRRSSHRGFLPDHHSSGPPQSAACSVSAISNTTFLGKTSFSLSTPSADTGFEASIMRGHINRSLSQLDQPREGGLNCRGSDHHHS